ncbi:MAG TPA: Gfo/Idh/MocA family oxidoreductase [Dokdonella sp.]
MNARLRPAPRAPRLGFLGVGWIGRHRMRALREAGVGEVAALADAQPDVLAAAADDAPAAERVDSLDALLACDLDGVVIATPSALHAAQAVAALERGVAVFCQKPLARTAAEARRVVDAARANDRLLGVDFSYRFVAGIVPLREAILRGELGRIYAVDLCFHNAYGPDKPWFYDVAQSGGGCVMDLGIHLVDLAEWVTGDVPGMDPVDARLYAQGRALSTPVDAVEDYAAVQWRTAAGACVRLACSWRLPAGRDAVIEAAFYGTHGGAALRNVDGSFYDFTLERFDGTRRERLAGPPDAWGGRALVHWAERLAGGAGFDAEAERFVDVAHTIDRIYGR